jgi:hypothetical protein
VDVNILVEDAAKLNHVIGVCTIIYRFRMTRKMPSGHELVVTFQHPTAAVIFLFNPQTYQQMHDQESPISGRQVLKHLKDHNSDIPIDSGPSNLHLVWNPSVSAKKQMENVPHFVLKLGFCDVYLELSFHCLIC